MRYCLEIKRTNFFAVDLYNRIKQYKAHLIDLDTRVYITGVASYENFAAILRECVAYGVVQCEVGTERRRWP